MASEKELHAARVPLPEEPIHQIVAPITRFLHVEAASGCVLLAFSALALVLANSAVAESFLGFWKIPVGFDFGEFSVRHSLKHWINDGLMVVFFFVIGLEVKREVVLGELRDMRRAALPVAAAIGGMLVPAIVYLLLAPEGPARAGWGIPMATDIAFVVGALALLGPRVPASLRILLLSLAIADDIGAILVIAIGYTASLDMGALALGVGFIAVVVGAARLGVRSVSVYSVLGVVVWYFFEKSGVHATIAGVILGFLTPAHSWVSRGLLGENVSRVGHFLAGEGWQKASERRETLRRVELAVREASSPLERLEALLHPWVGFAIMPVFAFANAGVAVELSVLTDPVSISVMLGLLIGKPVGIVLASLLAVRLGIALLPDGIDTWVLIGAGCLAGIGFTMALFIAGLAVSGGDLDAAKLGTLTGSAISGVIGFTILRWRLQPAAV